MFSTPVALLAPAVTRRDGLYLSFHFNLPASPAMTLVPTGLFILVDSFWRRLFTGMAAPSDTSLPAASTHLSLTVHVI